MLRAVTIEGLLGLDWNNEYEFNKYFQEGEREGAQYLSLNQLIVAYTNTKEKVGQFAVSDSAVEKLVIDIFVTNGELEKDLFLHEVEGEYYLIGGRHRLYALKSAFDQVITHGEGIDPRLLYGQLIRVEVLKKWDFDKLGAAILADNGSRTALKAEQEYVRAQKYGADRKNPISFVLTAFMNLNSPAATTNQAGQYFVWKYQGSKVEGSTRQAMGKLFSSYILYGKRVVTKGSKIKMRDGDKFKEIAEALWEEVEQIAVDREVFTQDAKEVAAEAIERYEKNAA